LTRIREMAILKVWKHEGAAERPGMSLIIAITLEAQAVLAPQAAAQDPPPVGRGIHPRRSLSG
jgi:hypothetical protein